MKQVLDGVDFVAELMEKEGSQGRKEEETTVVANRKRMYEECCVNEDGPSAATGIKFPVKSRYDIMLFTYSIVTSVSEDWHFLTQ